MPAETKISKEKHRARATVTAESRKELLHLINGLNCALRYTCKHRRRLKHVNRITRIAMTYFDKHVVMVYYCILLLWLIALKGIPSFSFPDFSYCKVLSSEFLYCTAYAEVYVFIICAASIMVVFFVSVSFASVGLGFPSLFVTKRLGR